jgi:hypothetical protein
MTMHRALIAMTLTLALMGCNKAKTGGDTSTADTDTDTETDTDTDADADTDADTDTDTDAIPDLIGHVTDFDIRHVKEQSYWYSRYNLLALNMQSANGVTFMPDPMMMDQVVMMTSDADSTSVVPTNPAMLMRVHETGEPSYINADDGDMMDFMDQRWDASPSTASTGASTGWTMLKELEWAKQFHVDAHFGSPNDGQGIPGAQQRMAGVVMYISAMMQANEWMMNGAAFDQTDPGGQYVMLEAMADLSEMTSATAMPNSVDNRYRMVADMMAPTMGMQDADEMAMGFMMGADMIFMADPTVTTVEDQSLAIQALAWYAAANAMNRQDAKDRMTTLADSLMAASPANAVEHAFVIRGLLEANRVLGDAAYMTGAETSYAALEADFDWPNGVFDSQSTYSVDDIGVVVGALNAMLIFGDASLDTVIPMLEHFFEATVNISGLQISAPPVSMIAPYEQFGDELFHRYPTTPMPPMAGGNNALGIAPVFADEVTFDGAAWTADQTFDSAGAMHLANEMLWMHVNEVNGFPTVP